MYKLTNNPDMIIRTTDGACIPRGHRWWIEYEEWLAEGNTPEPVDTPLVTQADYQGAVQALLDDKAKERKYDGILSLCTYVTSTNPGFAAEGQAGVAWRDASWAKCYEVLTAVGAGTRTQPTVAELLAELPAMAWPI